MISAVERPLVAAWLTHGWTVRGTGQGAAIRAAFATNLEATDDPVAAAILTNSETIRRATDSDALRSVYRKAASLTGDPIAAATLVDALSVRSGRDIEGVLLNYMTNVATTRDARAAATLTNGWATTSNLTGDQVLAAYTTNLAATNDAQVAALLTSGSAIRRDIGGDKVRSAYVENLAATNDARAAATLTKGWAASRYTGDEIRVSYAKNLAATQSPEAAALLTSGWTAQTKISGDHIRSRFELNASMLGRYDPDERALAEATLERVRAGSESDADIMKIMMSYESSEVAERLPSLYWRILANGTSKGLGHGDLRFFNGVLMRAEQHLAAVPPNPATDQLRRDTLELIHRNLERLRGIHDAQQVRGYRNHVDYAEVGRVIENVSLLDKFAAVPKSATAIPESATAGAALGAENTLTW